MGLAMRTYTCSTCGELIPRPAATIRPVALRQVTYCRSCFDELMAVMVPMPRTAADELLSPRAG